MSAHFAKLSFQFFHVQCVKFTVFIQDCAVDHRQAHIRGSRRISKRPHGCDHGQIVSTAKIKQCKIGAVPDRDPPAIGTPLRARTVFGSQLKGILCTHTVGCSCCPLGKQKRRLHLPQKVKTVIGSGTVGPKRNIHPCGKCYIQRHDPAAKLQITDGIMYRTCPMGGKDGSVFIGQMHTVCRNDGHIQKAVL